MALWLASRLGGGTASAQTVKIGTPSFLTGAAAPARYPAKKGAELIVRGINNGELPAPYNNSGLAGRQIELPVMMRPVAARSRSLTAYKVQKDNVDAIIGIISSGTCAALTKVAEEPKVLTIQTVAARRGCLRKSTRIRNTSSTINHATANNVSAARYLGPR